MKRFVALLLVGTMLTGLVACGSSSGGSGSTDTATTDTQQEEEQETSEGEEEQAGVSESIDKANDSNSDYVTETTEGSGERTVTVGISGDPVSFSPWEANTEGRKNILASVYQMLAPTYINPETGQFEAYYVLMSGYDHVPDSTEYTIHIREGIKDSEGNKIDANDVEFSYRMAAESGFNANAKSINEMEVVDDYTIKFIFSDVLAIGAFEDIISDVFVVSQASYEASPDGMISYPVGSSGYVLSDYQVGSSATLTKAENGYWNEAANETESFDDGYCTLYDTKNVDKVVFEFILDTSTMAIALETGEIDIANNISSSDVVLFEEGGVDAEDFNMWVFPGDSLSVAANMDSGSPMSNINLRKAVFYSFDNASVIYGCYGDYGSLCYSWDAPYRGDYNPKYETTDYFNYNEETAKEYLEKYYEETGTSVKDLSLTILCSNQGENQKAAQLIQNSFCNIVGSDTAMNILCVDDSILKTTWADAAAFDMVLDAEAAETLYSSNTWRKSALASAQSNGMAMFFNDDPKVQELLLPAIAESTHSQDTCDAFNEYITEMAYRKCIGTGAGYRAAADWIGRVLKGPKSSINVCGMKYDWAAHE